MHNERTRLRGRSHLVRHVCATSMLAAVVIMGVSACSDAGATSAPAKSIPSSTAGGHQRALEKQAQCMRDRGWNSRVEGDGITTTTTPEQESAFQADDAECGKGIAPDVSKLSDAEWKKAYDGQVATGTCLKKYGYTVNPPSLQVFTSTNGEWNAYSELLTAGAINSSDFAKLEKLCPQSSYWPGD